VNTPSRARAQKSGGAPRIDHLLVETHTCYLGDREHRYIWSFGVIFFKRGKR
jgi:7-cyano-7-deazaguanine synthase